MHFINFIIHTRCLKTREIPKKRIILFYTKSLMKGFTPKIWKGSHRNKVKRPRFIWHMFNNATKCQNEENNISCIFQRAAARIGWPPWGFLLSFIFFIQLLKLTSFRLCSFTLFSLYSYSSWPPWGFVLSVYFLYTATQADIL